MAEERLNTFSTVEIRLPNPDGDLKPGMPADASWELVMGSEQKLLGKFYYLL